MLNNIKEPAFFERYGYWKDYGGGTMLVYIAPPKKDSLRWTCEYVMFQPDYSYKRTVINQDLLDLYARGE